MSRSIRLHTLRQILSTDSAATQEDLVESLAEVGLQVTQATISRDLASIGAVRGPDGYLLADRVGLATRTRDESGLTAAIRLHAISVAKADSLVVVRTAPGHADVLATELDAGPPDQMVGCIAGDDTIFVATASTKHAGDLVRVFQGMLEG